MIDYQDALDKILKNTCVLGAERVSVCESVGQVLTENVFSDIDLPHTDISGFDGYAVRSADLKGASRHRPSHLRITGTVRAGRVTRRTVKPGTAIRIMTGAVVPDGADCVVRFEDTDEPANKNGPNPFNPSTVRIYAAPHPGKGIRQRGSVIKKGSPVLAKGTTVGPAQISTLLSIGRTTVSVIRLPVVTIIATGDELISVDRQLRPGKIYNSNAAALASLVALYGGIPRILGVARDNEKSLIEKIRKGISSDAIITTGGISHGDYDLVRSILGKIGKVVFSQVRMGSGTGMVFGRIWRTDTRRADQAVPVFALTGAPSGCLINFETLVRPALMKMRGMNRAGHRQVEATAVDGTVNEKDMPYARWTRLEEDRGRYRVTLNTGTDKGDLVSSAIANSLTIIPGRAMIRSGDAVRVLPLNWEFGDVSRTVGYTGRAKIAREGRR